jgi:hypothetical protein
LAFIVPSLSLSKQANQLDRPSGTMTSKYNKQDLYDVEGLVAVVTGGMLLSVKHTPKA